MGKARGCSYFDFRTIPEILEPGEEMWGVYEYKKGFGGFSRLNIPTQDHAYRPLVYTAWRKFVEMRRAPHHAERKKVELERAPGRRRAMRGLPSSSGEVLQENERIKYMEARIITDRQQWNDFVAQSVCCNITQSYEWGELAPHLDAEAMCVGVVDDAGKLCAAMLVLIVRAPVLRRSYFYVHAAPSLTTLILQR